jgi:adenylate cyclase
MADSGLPGGIQVSETTYRRLRAHYLFKLRGRYYLPNIGEISTYLLTGRI